MKYFVIALKGWYEVRKGLKPLKRVETKAHYFKDGRSLATERDEDGFIRFKTDKLGRRISKRSKQKVNITVVDWEGGRKVAMLRPLEMGVIDRYAYRMQPGDMKQLEDSLVERLKKVVKL